MNKVLTLFVFFLLTACGNSTYANASPPQARELTEKAVLALAVKDKKQAYKDFIRLFLIKSPHPDKATQAYISEALAGNSNAFAKVAMSIRLSTAGFVADDNTPLISKLALARALKDGSPYGAYYTGLTFVYSLTADSNEKFSEFLTGLYWLGVASGMGHKSAYSEAMELIEGQYKDILADDGKSYEERLKNREDRKSVV